MKKLLAVLMTLTMVFGVAAISSAACFNCGGTAALTIDRGCEGFHNCAPWDFENPGDYFNTTPNRAAFKVADCIPEAFETLEAGDAVDISLEILVDSGSGPVSGDNGVYWAENVGIVGIPLGTYNNQTDACNDEGYAQHFNGPYKYLLTNGSVGGVDTGDVCDIADNDRIVKIVPNRALASQMGISTGYQITDNDDRATWAIDIPKMRVDSDKVQCGETVWVKICMSRYTGGICEELPCCCEIYIGGLGGIRSSIPDTGQTKCYNGTVEIPCPSPGEEFYGQDAQYNGPQHSYTKMGSNGVELPDTATSAQGWIMTRDNTTGLIWEIKQAKNGTKNYLNPNDADNTYTVTPGEGTDTKDFINSLIASNFGGFSDWRMPTREELAFLVDSGTFDPAINSSFFPNTQAFFHWSSSLNGWGVSFSNGDASSNVLSYSGYVRAVRGVDSTFFLERMQSNINGTVIDTETGLIWQKATAIGNYNWQEALAYTETLSLAGYSDWRLPNKNELLSLLGYIDYDTFPETETDAGYWSSTTQANNKVKAWFVDFGSEDDGSYDKGGANNLYVRAVRGEQSGRMLSVSPTSRSVAKEAGTTIFRVSNTGTGAMPWTAAVTSGGSWLSIISGSSGTNAGTITCAFLANATISARTGTIRITAADATGGPVDVTVTQAETPQQLYDLDGDGDVDIVDVMKVAARWNTATEDPNYDETCDLDHDGDIDIVDVMKVAAQWGWTA